jgi:hypothetical protein
MLFCNKNVNNVDFFVLYLMILTGKLCFLFVFLAGTGAENDCG